MLNTLLLILKIIGIVLIAVIVLVIIAAAVVLFVPIRYVGSGNYKDGVKPHGKIYVSWLCKIIRAQVQYEDGLSYEVRIFGKKIYPKEAAEDDGDIRETQNTEAGTTETDASVGAGDDAGNGNLTHDVDAKNANIQPQADTGDGEAARDANTQKVQDITQDPDIQSTQSEEIEQGAEDGVQDKTEGREPSIEDRVGAVFDRIKQKVSDAAERIRELCEKSEQLAAFLENESHKRAFNLLWQSLKRLLRHVGPRSLTGHAIFGFDDPAATGYVLALLSLFPMSPSLSKDFDVVPMFDRNIKDIDAAFKGRIRVIVPLRIGLKVWSDGDFKKLYTEVTDGRK